MIGFLPKERRNAALHSLLICDGNYYNLIVNQNLRQKRFLRYCPVCAREDRDRLGETYWHREHQNIHVDICPKHRCFLKNSTVPIGSKVTPGLYAAEMEVPFDAELEPYENEHLIAFIQYVLSRSFQGHEIHCSKVWRERGALHHRTFLNRFFPFVFSTFAEIESFSHPTKSPPGKFGFLTGLFTQKH